MPCVRLDQGINLLLIIRAGSLDASCTIRLGDKLIAYYKSHNPSYNEEVF